MRRRHVRSIAIIANYIVPILTFLDILTQLIYFILAFVVDETSPEQLFHIALFFSLLRLLDSRSILGQLTLVKERWLFLFLFKQSWVQHGISFFRSFAQYFVKWLERPKVALWEVFLSRMRVKGSIWTSLSGWSIHLILVAQDNIILLYIHEIVTRMLICVLINQRFWEIVGEDRVYLSVGTRLVSIVSINLEVVQERQIGATSWERSWHLRATILTWSSMSGHNFLLLIDGFQVLLLGLGLLFLSALSQLSSGLSHV